MEQNQKKIKTLKKILQSKIFYILLILGTCFYIIINCSIPRNSIYDLDDTSFEGTLIKSIKKKDRQVLTLEKDGEKLICNYYLKDDKSIPKLKLGYKIKIDGSLKEPENNTIPNTFNYRDYLYNHHSFYTCTVLKVDIEDKRINILYDIKNHIIDRISTFEISDYMNTFIIGNNADMDDETLEKYRNNGVSHLFAISGMHVGLFSLILLKLFKRMKEKKRYLIVSSLIWIIAFLAGFTPSVIRACLFFTILSINKCFKLDLNELQVLIWTAVILCIHDYMVIKDIGFIYSFLTTGGLIYSSKYGFKNKSMNTSLVATLYSAPVTIMNFYKINLLSLLYNLILVPFVSVIIYPLVLLTFLVRFLEPITKIMLSILEVMNNLFAHIKFATITVPRVSLVLIVIYYIILIFFWKKNPLKWTLILLVFILSWKLKPIIDSNFYVETLDVGQGDSILIRSPHARETILIDTGGIKSWNSSNDYHVSEKTITYLNSLGLDRIDKLVLSHGDYDHMGEAVYLINNFKVNRVVFNCGPYNNLENELIKVIDGKDIEHDRCIGELDLDDNKLYFLNTGKYDNENDNSNVIYTELNGYKFLFMGDASTLTEQKILKNYNISNIDVLKVGHHGSKTSSSKYFIDTIDPTYGVISVGKNNRYGHPNKEVLDNLNNSKIYRTDQDGSIMFKIKNNKLEIETCPP